MRFNIVAQNCFEDLDLECVSYLEIRISNLT